MKHGHSEILNQDYIINYTGELTTADNVKYSRDEMKKLMGVNHDVLRNVHAVKKMFSGEVVK